ncbi:hypothetical protein PVL29_012226 [Vitis rotundifolia]|uniref:Disease resistance R13L4/SHOC-2-like LRR domain-containing protein n=1 Tax=Vitis rotundifolia TaxID=103349 RepID=A0AA38ZS60_VITRO|nr:hypothetical protein PVL29_012226 [Vitis rotundifolia]
MERISILGFILAILYFITMELACNGYTHISNNVQSEQEALIDFKSGSNYCYWQGITCEKDTGIVISIDLHNPYPRENVYENWSSMNLSGEIRPSLTKLKSLKYLDLSFNSFKGMPIPQLFGFLKNLLHLNLSGAEFSGTIPSNFGNLSNLQYLDLSSYHPSYMTSLVFLKYLGMDYVNLSLVGSQWVEVLNKLPILTELHLDGCSLSGSIPSPSFVNFTSLFVISIKSNQFISMFPKWLLNVSSLGSIDISYNQLHGRIPLGLGELPNLQYIDLSWNSNFRGSISQLLRNSWKKIEFLNLAGNELHGPIPSSFENFCNLKYLDLSDNNLNGSLPEIIKGIETCSSRSPLPNLKELHLYNDQLMGKLPTWLGELKNLRRLDLSLNKLEGLIPASLGTLRHLESLSLRMNELNGSLPDSIGRLSQLQQLDVYSNHLSGSLPDSIGQLSQLQYLDVGYNQLSGSLSEQHFWKLSKLKALYIDSNSFHLNVSPNWVPPFQLNVLFMGSYYLGPAFPTWLQSQKNLQSLDFSNASISSRIPNWFWNISFNLGYLSLSHNQLQGQLPNSLNFSTPDSVQIDFSSNLFEGPIPFSIKGVDFLDLSHNKISGPIPLSRSESLSYLVLSHNQITGPIPSNIGEFLPSLYFLSISSNRITGTIPDSIGHLTSLEVIDFSRNNLTGSIPSTINNCSRLIVLDLGNNNLSGMIPKSLGRLQLLQSLHLNDNKLSGELPSSFQNLSSLELLDLSYNELSGKVPSWIGTAFINLVILNLRSNAFFGRLPDRLSNLSSLHLKAMAQEHNMDMYSLYHNGNGSSRYDERLIVNTKGQSLEYTRTLSLVVSIDLSDNNLSGELPEGITKLFGLVFLNLSMNHIIGQIPRSISMLCQLSSLDLSSNKLSGTIPSSMPLLTFLGYLNLSNNNFSGKIPFTGQMTTFTELAFAGNPNLCGTPLVTKCQDEDLDKRQSALEDKIDGSYVDQWFYLSIGLGFAVGILVPYFVLAIRRSWCDAYFDFVDKIVEWLLFRRRVTDAKNHARRQ